MGLENQRGYIGNVILVGKDVVVVNRGEVVRVLTDKAAPRSGLEREKKGFPEGTIESLLPIFQLAEENYREVLCPEPGFWEELLIKSEYSFEQAVNKIRRHGHGVKETSAELMERILNISKVVGKDRTAAKEVLGSWLEEEIHELFVSTTKSSPKRK